MKSLTRFNGLAERVVFHVACDEGLGEDGRGEMRDDDAKGQQEDE
jgi:hypothetical protein